MIDKDNNKPECPVGEAECDRINELVASREEIEVLSQLVHKDNLTGLFNFRHFELVLGQELERTHRTGQPTALIMLDLDHFKQVNDEWGHEVGNQVLRHVSSIMTQVLRRIDIPCRYGGEEFALLLPSTPLPRAVQAAERVRQAIEDSPVELGDEQITVTASLGVGIYVRNAKLTADTFVRQVDGQLYRAKEEGRNRVAHEDLEQYKPKGQVGREEKALLFGNDE